MIQKIFVFIVFEEDKGSQPLLTYDSYELSK